MNSYKCEWQKYLERTRPEYVEVLRDFPEFKNWDKSCYPDMGCNHELKLALEILYADPDCELGTAFLQRIINMAERAIREDKLHSEKCASSFPLSEGSLLHTYVYAQFFKVGTLDADLLLKAAHDYVQWFADTPAYDKDDFYEYFILSAARLFLLCGEFTLAKETLGMKRKFRWHAEEWRLLTTLIAGKVDSVFRTSFETYFDFIRSPRWIQPIEYFCDDKIARVDLALIAAKFLDQDAWPPNPRKILERISA